MFRKKQNGKLKMNTSRYGKGGFTLVELCVTMALVGILATMVVSFAFMMSDSVKDNRVEYTFLEDHADLKESLSTFVAENDLAGNEFSVENGRLTVSGKEVKFRDGVLKAGDVQLGTFDMIEGIKFEKDDEHDNLIKCVTYRNDGIKGSFVIALRLATVNGGGSSQ